MRIRLTAPHGAYLRVRYLDSVHGALVNAWTSCGIRGTDVIGREAGNWSFGAIGAATAAGFVMKSLVVGAEGRLAAVLPRLAPETIRKSSANGDAVDLSSWDRIRDDLPIVCEPGETAEFRSLRRAGAAIHRADRIHPARRATRDHQNVSRIVQSAPSASVLAE